MFYLSVWQLRRFDSLWAVSDFFLSIMIYEVDLSGETPLAFNHVGSLEIRGKNLTIGDIYGDRVHVQQTSVWYQGGPRWNTIWDVKTQRVTSWYPTCKAPLSFVDQVSGE